MACGQTTVVGTSQLLTCSYACDVGVTTSEKEATNHLKTTMVALQEVSVDAATASVTLELESIFYSTKSNKWALIAVLQKMVLLFSRLASVRV